MRGMNSNSVDLIYLDPPFNSNRNYSAPIGSEAAGAAFKDTWTLDDVDLAEHGEIADRNPALYKVIDAAGDAHGKGMKSYLIMMGTRLLEMRRLLKDSGSIYLHCDPTAGHYLKLVMDAVFGSGNFVNEIVWRRFGSHNDATRRYGRVHDILLFYSMGDRFTWNRVFEPYDEEYLKKSYRNKDSRGRYTTSPLQARTLSGGGYEYEWKGIVDIWKFPMERLEALDAEGLIHWPEKGSIPRRKVYLDEAKGVPARDVILDIKPLSTGAKERLGYPTQKPLALLKRIIAASSQPDDVVLDPFCGCATACIAAEQLDRQWVGIDLSPLAAALVLRRAENEIGSLFAIDHRTDIPRRTDLGKLPNYRTHKHTLYGLQEGVCAGCQVHFPFRNLTVDHKTPRSRGGGDHFENLQLLCGACNSAKGDGTMAELLARLNH
ncbi:MAG: DNA methyltransferase [Chloroflexi bacterium]|nr:DNA methyltransferase [Chloroflexota bacterium]